MSEYIVEQHTTSSGWTWTEPTGKLVRCKDCKYDHNCTHMMVRESASGNIYCHVEYCSEGKRKE